MEDIGPESSGVKIVTRLFVFQKTKECKERDFVTRLDFVEQKFVNNSSFPSEAKADFSHNFSRLKSEMKAKWQAAKRTESTFLKNNNTWLQGTLKIPCRSTSNVGRPVKDFKMSSERSKRRKTEKLRQNDTEEVLYAGQMLLREKGNVSGASIVKDLMTSPKRGDKYRKAFRKSGTPNTSVTRQLTPVNALSMFVEASLTRKQYEIVRLSDKKLYPCYSILQKAKKQCYTPDQSYRVTATCAEIELQALLDHTVKRLILYLEEVLNTLDESEYCSLELICKWGCDGSQQTQYKQKFENTTDSDANIFQSSLVPLRLISTVNGKVIWQNSTPSSPRFCRPMRIRFIHETKDVTNEEIYYFNDKIKQLQLTNIIYRNVEISVQHKMLFTMVDGKVCNAATQTASTMRCYICKATSKQFNDLSNSNVEETANIEFGLSVLHARLRFFETLLHLAYKIPVQKWQIRSQAEKDIVKAKKIEIQERFKNELGLIVDMPKAGFGTSNDGNTSRRFFSNAALSSCITGVDQNLIERFATVLEVISSGHEINVDKFAEYCLATAKVYVDLYHWHPMTPTVHKVLIHGPVIVQHSLLPIGSLSEEAAEARNKHFRQYRQNFARKFSREQCNMDIINRLLLTSDPYLSSIRPKPPKNSKAFTAAAMEMLLPSISDPDFSYDEMKSAQTSDLSENFDDSSDDEAWCGSSE